MRTNAIVMLVLAVVFGSVAAFLANVWLQNQSPTQTTATPAPVAETSTIVVAAIDLGFGVALQPESLREIPWSRSSVPDGAFARISDLTGDGRRVVLSPISPNEPILKWKISGPGARASLSAVVKEGMRAVTVRINDVAGVGGFMLPGDRVDVLYTRSSNQQKDEPASTDTLIQNVRVLAVDQDANSKSDQPVIAKAATLEVTTGDAQKIALAQTTGSLSLTLRSAGSLDQAPPQRVVEQELVSSPSVYQNEFDARKVAQAAIDAKLNKLEGSIENVAKKVAETDSGKEQLARKLSDIEKNLKGEIASTNAKSSDALKGKLADLEEALKQTASATGQGEQALRVKLTALEKALRQAAQATGLGDEALRAKLAEFEAGLKHLASTPPQIVMAEPAAYETTFVPAEKLTKSVGVIRGVKRDSYEVPLDATSQ